MQKTPATMIEEMIKRRRRPGVSSGDGLRLISAIEFAQTGEVAAWQEAPLQPYSQFQEHNSGNKVQQQLDRKLPGDLRRDAYILPEKIQRKSEQERLQNGAGHDQEQEQYRTFRVDSRYDATDRQKNRQHDEPVETGERAAHTIEKPAHQVDDQTAAPRAFVQAEINHQQQDQVRLVVALQQQWHQDRLQNGRHPGQGKINQGPVHCGLRNSTRTSSRWEKSTAGVTSIAWKRPNSCLSTLCTSPTINPLGKTPPMPLVAVGGGRAPGVGACGGGREWRRRPARGGGVIRGGRLSWRGLGAAGDGS